MSYVKEVLENTSKDKNYEKTNIKKLVLRANNPVKNEDIWDLKNTKALKLEDMSNTDKEYDNRESWGELLLSAHDRPMTGVDVSTWSSLMRHAVDILKPQIDYALHTIGSEEFKDTFRLNIEKLCESFKLNYNCPMRLFKASEELELIRSSVYRSNKNHMLKIITDEDGIDWYICAVYTGEVIIMLEALLDTIYDLSEYTSHKDKLEDYPHHTFVISYTNREELSVNDEFPADEDVIEGCDGIDKSQLAKDLVFLCLKLNSVNTLVENIAVKYNINLFEEMSKMYSLDK